MIRLLCPLTLQSPDVLALYKRTAVWLNLNPSLSTIEYKVINAILAEYVTARETLPERPRIRPPCRSHRPSNIRRPQSAWRTHRNDTCRASCVRAAMMAMIVAPSSNLVVRLISFHPSTELPLFPCSRSRRMLDVLPAPFAAQLLLLAVLLVARASALFIPPWAAGAPAFTKSSVGPASLAAGASQDAHVNSFGQVESRLRTRRGWGRRGAARIDNDNDAVPETLSASASLVETVTITVTAASQGSVTGLPSASAITTASPLSSSALTSSDSTRFPGSTTITPSSLPTAQTSVSGFPSLTVLPFESTTTSAAASTTAPVVSSGTASSDGSATFASTASTSGS
ncbi:hypothetical protein WOLCODRAFT_160110 [Wolfiporia cocos MD-104 SS10]|uniref:Uncharacterized protein n=1 Tax=Wolfiporia cocos (strain MD-104) TaxID=742152 RepID=A0A2H3IVP7_WOLCO|nr:hypothetical protein WOLCODRAFT_160110 [Wolfiporia cocos MD-104 SS10]